MIVLALLLQAATVSADACAPGVYLADGDALTAIPERLTDHRKVSNLLGYALLGGFSTLKVKTVLPGKTATVRTRASRPSFIFCAPAPKAVEANGDAMGYVGVSAPAQSPREFRLVRFDVEGEQRETPLSAMSVTGPKAGAVQKATVHFDVEELSPGRFRVVPKQDLAAGEYGFLKTTGNTSLANSNNAAQERVFDFAVE